MILYVTDANIFIDLIHAEMLQLISELDLQLATTPQVLEEIDPEQQKELFALIFLKGIWLFVRYLRRKLLH